MINERTVPTEWYDYEAKKADRYWKEWRESAHLAATLTGFLSGMAKWDDEISDWTRIKMLNLLIKQYEPIQDQNEVYALWIAEWKKIKEDLEK